MRADESLVAETGAINVLTHREIINSESIAEAATGLGLKLLVLFGSYARGDHSEDSDFDLAYLVGERDIDPSEFESVFQLFAPARVHALSLTQTSVTVCLEVVNTGKCLYQDELGRWEAFKEEMMSGWEEYRPEYERQKEEEYGNGIPHSVVKRDYS